MFEFNSLDLWKFEASGVSFLIILFLLISLRVLKGFISNVSTHDELTQKDNAAFGISFAGGITAMAIMLSGASAGHYADTILKDAINMLIFGLVGMAMIIAGRLIQDKIALRKINILEQIKQGNLAAAYADVGNVIAIGIVIRAAMLWVDTEGWAALPIICAAFVVSQVVLMGGSILLILQFKSRNSGGQNCLQSALESGNHALGVRYAGYMIGIALAITAASGVAIYDPVNLLIAVSSWVVAALVFSVAFVIFSAIARRAILPGVDASDEVDRQRNAAIGSIEAAIAIAIGLAFVSLFG